jgi:hypothetical protein
MRDSDQWCDGNPTLIDAEERPDFVATQAAELARAS